MVLDGGMMPPEVAAGSNVPDVEDPALGVMRALKTAASILALSEIGVAFARADFESPICFLRACSRFLSSSFSVGFTGGGNLGGAAVEKFVDGRSGISSSSTFLGSSSLGLPLSLRLSA